MNFSVNSLSIEQITSLYLFGSLTTPTNLADEGFIRPAGATNITVEVNADEYFDAGAGRFANEMLFLHQLGFEA